MPLFVCCRIDKLRNNFNFILAPSKKAVSLVFFLEKRKQDKEKNTIITVKVSKAKKAVSLVFFSEKRKQDKEKI